MLKILLAEDDALLSSILVTTLKHAGFDVHASADGFEAELEIKTWHPDLVLLDLMMPNEDGFGVLRNIRSDTETFKTHVIVLSNLSEAKTIDEVKKFGVNEYFIKANTTPSDLVKKLKVLFPEA